MMAGVTMKAKAKTRMGRPPLPRGTQKAIRLSVRVTPAEAKMLRAAGKKQGITISDLLMEPWREGTERR